MLNADGVAAMEDLRAELAQAKEQARKSNAAAHCRSREEMAKMAVKLKDATDCCGFLEREC